MTNTKALASVEIKNADKGEVEAVFSTFDVKDHDGDVTLKGAFQDGAPVRISAFNHASWDGALPVGKGTIRVDGDRVVMKGQFFLNTTHGRDTFETVKALSEAGLQEWSYGFDITESERGEFKGESVRFIKSVKVHEVSPVLLGAGIGTQTLSVKGHAAPVKPRTFSEEGEEVLASVVAFGVRAAEVVAMRQAKGRGLGDESSALVERIRAELKQLEEVLTPGSTEETNADENDDTAAELQREWLRSIAANLPKE
ncbi:HK97 family phage prohead protease [Streptomyces sp. NPDC101150]|uniref:HK97 family phage prohead protease n=1 Tax=Streptomyces sp. NPDC101150 TaxID=3366114 RepID=UPI003816C068